MKKTISLLLTGAMALSLCACGSQAKPEATGTQAADTTEIVTSDKDETADATTAEVQDITLKVWGDQTEQDILSTLCDEFAAAHPENNWTFEYGVVGAADAQARYLEDPAAAADVFVFPDDQLITLVDADALYEVTRNVDEIKSANAPGTIDAASLEGTLYGYPMTADNGYYLYYDKSVLTEDDVKTLDGILAKANAAGKKVHMDVANGWYIASFFIGNGCSLTLDADGKQICDFNSPAGLEAAEAIKEFCANPAYISGDDSVLQGGIGDTICCGISGPWTAVAIKEKLGDNYAAAKLPTFTCGGKQVQMASFLGCKVLGVNTQTAHPVEAMELAEFLTNEDSQIKRFEALSYGPSNITAADSDAVKADPALSALAEQSKYAISQHVLGNYWTPAQAFGADIIAGNANDLQSMLDQLVEQAIAE